MSCKFTLTVVAIVCALIPTLDAGAETLSDAEKELAENNTRFALDMFAQLKEEDGNLFFSPYSISTALAMTYAGARGDTETQMADALHFDLEQPDLHPAFGSLAARIEEAQREGEIMLNIANSLWPQKDYEFRSEYTNLLEKHYNAPVQPVDYINATEAAREAINAWVEEETREKITDLIAPGALDQLTRLVLVNAIYFKGDWKMQFEEDNTKNESFYVNGDKTVDTPMMRQKDRFHYAETEDLQILELPYEGDDVSMLVLLPRERGSLEKIEGMLEEKPGMLEEWAGKLRRREVRVYLPRFEIEWGAKSLVPALQALGIKDAFIGGEADFSGMDGTRELFIHDVVHKAFVDVNEEGTEAAAATGVTVGITSVQPEPPVFRADHPFLFLIREKTTDSLLFMGRLSEPEEAAVNDTAEEGKELQVIEQSRGTQANTEMGPSMRVAYTEEEWKNIQQLAGRRARLDDVDFEEQMVIAAFMGRRNTGGYSVTIESVLEYEEHIKVHYSFSTPEPDQMVTMAITSPFHIVAVPHVEGKDVKFLKDGEEEPHPPQEGRMPGTPRIERIEPDEVEE